MKNWQDLLTMNPALFIKTMHIIFSEPFDSSTNHLIDWFMYYDEKFIRYNGSHDEHVKSLDLNRSKINIQFGNQNEEFTYEIDNKVISNKNIKSIFLRRPSRQTSGFHHLIKGNESPFMDYLNSKLKQNGKVLKDLMVHNFETNSIRKVGCYRDHLNLNKPKVLLLAKKNGLLIPKTLITADKNIVSSFLKEHNNKIICKSLEEVISFIVNKKSTGYYCTYTMLVDNMKKINSIDFSTSLFQEYIEKDYEIRTFYHAGKFFSSAIFSQGNEKTKIDFRNYDEKKPNKMVPYQLPKNVEQNAHILMQELALDTGSIDFLVKGEVIYFLEINPLGQYDFVSQHCNFNIDLYLANYLIHEKEEL